MPSSFDMQAALNGFGGVAHGKKMEDSGAKINDRKL
jgi:hypothetical protein